MLPFAKTYPPELSDGFWGEITSTIDWCEENYVLSFYVAEFLNTTTNLIFIILATFAIVHAYINKLEPRFIFTGFGFLTVGIGSWFFHMTLKYHFQLLDELPMIYATCIPFWSVFSEFRSKQVSVFIGIGIFMAANTLTLVYLYVKNPTLHQAAYGILNFCIIFRSYQLSNKYVLDKNAKANLQSTLIWGLGLFLLGYMVWNVDIHFCGHLRDARRFVGIPYGVVLEGHGWWHIFTGLGIYYYLVYQEYLRCFLTGTEKFYTYKWVLGLPIVVCKDPSGLDTFKAQRLNKLKKD